MQYKWLSCSKFKFKFEALIRNMDALVQGETLQPVSHAFIQLVTICIRPRNIIQRLALLAGDVRAHIPSRFIQMHESCINGLANGMRPPLLGLDCGLNRRISVFSHQHHHVDNPFALYLSEYRADRKGCWTLRAIHEKHVGEPRGSKTQVSPSFGGPFSFERLILQPTNVYTGEAACDSIKTCGKEYGIKFDLFAVRHDHPIFGNSINGVLLQ